jgi:hypothetical protein
MDLAPLTALNGPYRFGVAAALAILAVLREPIRALLWIAVLKREEVPAKDRRALALAAASRSVLHSGLDATSGGHVRAWLLQRSQTTQTEVSSLRHGQPSLWDTPRMAEGSLGPYLARVDAGSARLESSLDAGDYRRRMGFRRAAILLLNAAVAEKLWQNRDPLVWPALYNFRHYMELELKYLARDGAVFGVAAPPTSHDLQKLWLPVRNGFDQVFGGSASEPNGVIESAISVLNALDPYADGFRYASRRDGTASIPQDVYLDPEALLPLVRQVVEVFETASLAFQAEADYVHEVRDAHSQH